MPSFLQQPQVASNNAVLGWAHGVGDTCHFAHLLRVLKSHAYVYQINTRSDLRPLFEAFRIPTSLEPPVAQVPWLEAKDVTPENASRYSEYNKAARNAGVAPLASAYRGDVLWSEIAAADPIRLVNACVHRVAATLSGLPQPIILLHICSHSGNGIKTMPAEIATRVCRRLLRETDGTIICLDWEPTINLPAWRFRSLARNMPELVHMGLDMLAAMISAADLLIGVDSGPLHLSRYTLTPAVGFWPNQTFYPSRFALPRKNQINVVPASLNHLNRQVRIDFPIMESPGPTIDADTIANASLAMLGPRRYVSDAGVDTMLQQWVLDWQRGDVAAERTGNANPLSPLCDRDRTFDLVLRRLVKLPNPVVVETGCARQVEDWGGAGYSTYLIGAFLHFLRTGSLTTVDIDPANCELARKETWRMGRVSVVCHDSVAYLHGRVGPPIDLLFLDSLDTTVPGHEEHCLREVRAGLTHMADDGWLLIDDTVFDGGRWRGKGALAVPYLLQEGWQLKYAGYQALLTRS